MNATRLLVFGALGAAAAWAQDAKPRPEFEVASIKAAPPYNVMSGAKMTIGLHIDGAQVHISDLTLKDYIRIAYQVPLQQIVAPEWASTPRWDIDAKLPAGSSRADVPGMLQSLLEDRFQLKYHRESKEFEVYGLVVAKGGPKLTESPADPAADGENPAKAALNVNVEGGPRGTTVRYSKDSYFTMANNKIECKKLDMTRFADLLGRFVDMPVVDMTDLKGSYDFDLQLTPEDFLAANIHSAIAAGISLPPEALRMAESANNDSLYAALQAQGLKLEKRRAPLQVLVVDSVAKTPIEN